MKTTSLAKITRPKLSGIYGRERLFRLLDQGRRKPVIWVAAQAGSGKTTLAASYLDARKLPCLWYQADAGDGDIASFFYYMSRAAKKAAPRYRDPLPLLTPEYLQGVAVFTRRFFEELFLRLKPDSVIVFDNYQDVPSSSSFDEMLLNGLAVIPERITVMVLSRTDPPPQFIRLQANNMIEVIGRDDIRFTRKEAGELVKAPLRVKPTEETVDVLYDKTEGWAAGLVLMSRAAQTSEPSEKWTSTAMFDYFTGEHFDKAGGQVRDFLLRTSFLPTLNSRMAEQLTGYRHAGHLLSDLRRRRFFITSDGGAVYQYHPLFREFLMSRARAVLPKEELHALLRMTASVLTEFGRPEQAAELYSKTADWESLIELSLRHAPQMTMQGRLQTLTDWLTRIPAEFYSAAPWLVYWLGVCRVPLSPPEGQAYFEKALHLFQERKDREGMLRSWAGAVNAVVIGLNAYAPLDRLIAWYNEQDRGTVFPTPELEAEVTANMTAALFGRQPDHPDFRMWADRSLAVARKTSVIELRLFAANYALLSYLWVGDFAGVQMALDEVRDLSSATNVSPLMKIAWKWLEANAHYWAGGDVESGLQAFSDSRDTANNYGIRSWDYMICVIGITGFLLKGDRESAERLLSDMKAMLMPERSQGYCHYHYLVAWCKTLSGDAVGALSHAELAVKLTVEIAGTGLFYPETPTRLGLANVLCENNDYAGAEAQLDIVRDLNKRTGSAALEFVHLLTRARLAFEQGTEREGVEYLQKAMQLGRSQNYVISMWWWQPDVFASLCRKALENGIEVAYVRGLVKKHGFEPDPERPSEHWPWHLRINTLGRFEVLLDDEPLRFGNKVQKKPLELLKALISLGGEASEDRISEALWPDAEGDSANRSFESALYRLRKLIGDKALRLHDRVLELDRRSCWVDAWEFQRLARRAGPVSDNEGEYARRFEKTLLLYRGLFLPNNAHQSWSVSLRERLKSDYIGLVTAYGCSWEGAGDWERAAACFQKGIETEELAEEFYQHLILCHVKLDQRVQAESVYRRCCAVLKHTLGLFPSPRTEELYASIRK